ncbi:DUF5916 domain-containing protein [candidate division KSB1 bacterium]
MIKRTLLLFIVVLIGNPGILFSQENVKVVKVEKFKAPEIDGILNDAEWLNSVKAADFIQMDPVEGDPASEKTEVYIIYDDENLYIGVKCFDTDPDNIKNNIEGRDGDIESDYIALCFDTFHDHLNAFSFGTNPAGTKFDGMWYNDAVYDQSWNGVWRVKTGLDNNGWTAEFKIPFSTIKYSEKANGTWGLNIRRVIARKNEISFWQNVTRNEGFRVSKFGHLKGLQEIKSGLNLEILPYVTNRNQKNRTSSFRAQNDNGITGFDIKYGITSNISATLTVNPDFAQIEADEDLINLTRYPLYLPERRPFFTEGASIYKTAGDLNFYSKRINEPVYGLKINGKIGKWNLGVLNCLNDNDMGIKSEINSGTLPENTKTDALYSVFRLSRDIYTKSQVGLISMSKEYSGKYSRLVGFDGHLRMKNYIELLFKGIKSFSDQDNGSGHSLHMELSRNTDIFVFFVKYREQTPGYRGNDIGFYNYSDFREVYSWIRIAPRLEKIGIRRFLHNLNILRENFWSSDFFDKSKLTAGWQYNTHLIFMNYWKLSGYIDRGNEYDRIENVLYPIHSYQLNFQNNMASDVFFGLMHRQGKYRTGYSWSYDSYARIKATDRLNIEFSYNKSLAKLVNKETDKLNSHYYEVWRSKFLFHLNRDLNTRLIFQYNSMGKRLDLYYLLSYNFRPKSFLYIAYTERFDETAYLDRNGIEMIPPFSSSNKILQVKLSYLFFK